jgi:uncharacterized damage-inducible protein DinB
VASSWTLSAQAGQDTTIASIRGVHNVVKGYLTKAAAQVPEDKYKYQPTKDVRTMGQLFGHVANASRMICSTASGMPAGSAGDAEKLATKAEIVKALNDAMSFCDHALTMITNANAGEVVDLFGQKHSRIGAMGFNNAHNFEHYGNIVTYMRMNGMVPPSSGGGGN